MSHSVLSRLPLARHAVDRDAGARFQPDLFDALLADASTRILPLWNGQALMSEPGSTTLALFASDEVTAALVRIYLGRTREAEGVEPCGTPVIAAVLTEAAALELQPDVIRWVSLRAVASVLSDRDAGLFTEALAVSNWHESHAYCPRCGMPTVVEQGGWMRRCFEDDNEIFPRTDPAVIASVIDADDRLLLGSNALWEHNRWSLLAGFVEAGETFEAAVVREIEEEAGLVVAEPQYLGSQPWPFPASLMVGFRTRLATGVNPDQATPDGEEILALRWFSREDIWKERGSLLLPGPSSIARSIVEEWYGGPLGEPPVQQQ